MFRSFVIAVIITMAAILETAADAIAATLPPPATDSPRLRLVASGRLWPRDAPGKRGGLRPGPPRNSLLSPGSFSIANCWGAAQCN